MSARFGYLDLPDVPSVIRQLAETETERPVDADHATYFLSTIELVRGEDPTMATWRKRLFLATSHITADAAEYFRLPRDRTVIMGSHIEV